METQALPDISAVPEPAPCAVHVVSSPELSADEKRARFQMKTQGTLSHESTKISEANSSPGTTHEADKTATKNDTFTDSDNEAWATQGFWIYESNKYMSTICKRTMRTCFFFITVEISKQDGHHISHSFGAARLTKMISSDGKIS